MPRQPAAAEATSAGDIPLQPDAETTTPVVLASRQPIPGVRQDYIGGLRGPVPDSVNEEPQAPLLAPRLSPKKQAAGLGGVYISQLLTSMTRPPSPSPSPKPSTKRRRKRRAVPSPSLRLKSGQPQQQPEPIAGPRPVPDAVVPPPPADRARDDFVCPPGIICAQRGSKICGSGELWASFLI